MNKTKSEQIQNMIAWQGLFSYNDDDDSVQEVNNLIFSRIMQRSVQFLILFTIK